MDDGSYARAALEVQNVMGRYVANVSGPDFAERMLALFDLDDPEVTLTIAAGPTLTGSDALRGYWTNLEKVMRANGGTLGAHMLTSPVVVVAEDGESASGQWQDVGTTLFGPGMGTPSPAEGHVYSAVREVSRYSVDFRLREGSWKISSLRWEILWTYPGELVDEDVFWLGSKTREPSAPPA
ncbi:nuclear transport factor 2 family protein [Streptomyces sp. NPDC003247]|uniref:nuclear transport factor 2 family protein n=1 Tax=Streptomyces sp. NPDC003247 TaxID=3364677 RepID=UPI00368D15BF